MDNHDFGDNSVGKEIVGEHGFCKIMKDGRLEGLDDDIEDDVEGEGPEDNGGTEDV